MAERNERWRWSGLALAGGSVLVWVLIAWLSPRPGSPPPPAPLPPVAAALDAGAPADLGPAQVKELRGQVERQVDGGWAALTADSRLARDERIRTGQGAHVLLELPQGTAIDVDESAELSVSQVSEFLKRLDLEKGRVVAEQKKTGVTVEVRGRGGAAASIKAPARFTVRETGTIFVVATETGHVNLEAAGKSVTVNAGQQSLVEGRSQPSAPAQIPVEVLLKVASHLAEEGRCLVEAAVPRGAELRLAGRSAAVVNGRVHELVPGGPGQPIPWEVRDVLGRTKQGTVRCSADAVKADTVDKIGFE